MTDQEILLGAIQELAQKLHARLDQIRSDLDQMMMMIGSDQIDPVTMTKNDFSKSDGIRSDPIRTMTMKNNDGAEAWLVDLAGRHGVNLAGLDLRAINRNIGWLKSNLATITCPEAYIRKMVSGCGPRTGFSSSKQINKFPSSSPGGCGSEVCPEIMGISADRVERAVAFYTPDVYMQIRPELEKYGKMFQTYNSSLENTMKTNIAVALAIKMGVLS